MLLHIIRFLLLLIAAICFLFSVPQPPPTSRVNLIAAGLLLWVVTVIITATEALPG